MSESESRTFRLEKQIVADLTSDDLIVNLDAVRQLPEGMTRQEVSDVGLQISLSTGVSAVAQGEKLERSTLLYIGVIAMLDKGDLVTTQNIVSHLRRTGGIMESLILARKFKKAKNQIVNCLQK